MPPLLPTKDLSLEVLVPSVSLWKASRSLGGNALGRIQSCYYLLLFLVMVSATIHSRHRLEAMGQTDHGLEPPACEPENPFLFLTNLSQAGCNSDRI